MDGRRRSLMVGLISMSMLLASSGSAAGGTTSRVKDLRPGRDSSSPSGFTKAAGAVVFAAKNHNGNLGLWRTDGTAAGTTELRENAQPSSFATLGASLYFNGYDGETGHEPWESDGTPGGTKLLKDIYPNVTPDQCYEYKGAHPCSSVPGGLIANAGNILFGATDGPKMRGLWRTDGTSAGTVLIKRGINPQQARVMGGSLYFISRQTPSGFPELWRTDGTSVGTELVKTLPEVEAPGKTAIIYGLTRVGDSLFFVLRIRQSGSLRWEL